ncbi:elongation factor P lysine(34) lysyltransferase, partial [Buchnera aphidicola]|nr:elongation factor P lysine(34) lysyltransferase [Buchnera aphidicola]
HKVLEVETPMLSLSTVTDVNFLAFKTCYSSISHRKKKTLWLITSPEYHMKRLLSANSGPIYQICHSFRNSEFGKYHNPEFTMLEWYQPFYSMHDLIKEVDIFLQYILGCKKSNKISYQDIFIKHLNIDPLSTNISEIRQKSKELQLEYLTDREKKLEKLIELLFLCKVEPNI